MTLPSAVAVPRLHGLLEQGADAADDIRRRVGVPDDALDRDLRALDVRRLGRQPALAGVRVGDDRGQRLVHLVRDRSRKLRKARRLARPCKSLLRQTQLFLRPNLTVDVQADDVPLHDRAFGVAHRRGARLDPAILAIEAPLAVLQSIGLAGGQGVGEERVDRVQIVRMNDRVQHVRQPRSAVDILDVEADEVTELLTEIYELAVRGDAPDVRGERLNEFSQRALALAQCEHRLLVLPGYGGHDERRKCRDGQKKLQHDLLLPLGLGIAGKLAGAGYREYRRDQSEEGQGDGGAFELEAHRGPKKRRHDDVGEGQVTAQGKGGDTKKDQPQDAGFHPSRGRELGLAAPVLEHDQRQWRYDQDPGGVSDPPQRPSRREGLRFYAKPRKCRTSHRRAYDWRNSGAQHDECENFPQGFQPNRAPADPVHEPCAGHRFKSVADIDQKGRRQRTVEPQELADQFSPDSPPASTTASCAWR